MGSDGPKTKRNIFEPDAQPRETAAERMSREQKQSGELSGRASDRPQPHNHVTHPTLKRPLDKRRSLSEFSDKPVKRSRPGETGEDRGSAHSRRQSPGRSGSRDRPHPRRPDHHNRAAKRRDHRPCTCSNLRVYVSNRSIGTNTMQHPKTPPPARTPRGSIQGSDHTISFKASSSTNLSVSIRSSYHSFDQTRDREPFV